MLVTDAAEVTGVRRTQDGFLVADVRAGRTGIQLYSGPEMGRPDQPVVRVYRPPEEVFDRAALGSAANRTVTISHPPAGVTADNWRDVAVGLTGADVVRDGEFVRVPLMLMDHAAVSAVEGGTRQLSFGYTCRLDWTAGQTADGEPYDAVQRGIRINHLAVVDRGRAGPECRIGDEDRLPAATLPNNPQTGERRMADELRSVVVDGITVQTTPQGAEMIGRLQQQVRDAAAAATNAATEHQRALQSRDGQIAALREQATQAQQAHDGAVAALRDTHTQELARLQGELDALRTQTSDAALDERVARRAVLVGQARVVLGDRFDATGQSDAAIRRAVVAAARPALAINDSTPDAYVQAAFDVVMASPDVARQQPQNRPDPARAGIMAGGGAPVMDRANTNEPTAKDRYLNRLTSDWMTAGAPVNGSRGA